MAWVLPIEPEKKSWVKEQEKKTLKQMMVDAEEALFTAQKGSLLDRIWNGETFCGECGKIIKKGIQHYNPLTKRCDL